MRSILRWVTRYVPGFETRWARFSKPVGTSWRVDETYVSIKAKWHYLYRAVDKHGHSEHILDWFHIVHAGGAALADGTRIPRRLRIPHQSSRNLSV